MSSIKKISIVPKRIFFFWGKQKMSWMRYMTLYSFHRLNPDWNIELWIYDSPIKTKVWDGVEKQDFFAYDGKDYFEEAEKIVEINTWKGLKETGPSHQSNLFKWYTLATRGGVYADMDILWIKPFDVYEKLKKYDVAISCFGDAFSIGLLSATPKNEFFAKVLGRALKSYSSRNYQSLGVKVLYDLLDCWWSTPKLFERLQQTWPRLRWFEIPKDWIYPARCFEMKQLFEQSIKLPDDCIGLHWYAGAEISQEWNSKLTEENVLEFNSTFCKCASKLI